MDWSAVFIRLSFWRHPFTAEHPLTHSDGTHSLQSIHWLSFWRHPFTAEHPLWRHWCRDTFLQTWWRNKLDYGVKCAVFVRFARYSYSMTSHYPDPICLSDIKPHLWHLCGPVDPPGRQPDQMISIKGSRLCILKSICHPTSLTSSPKHFKSIWSAGKLLNYMEAIQP